eukprot:Rmarinus@m.1921
MATIRPPQYDLHGSPNKRLSHQRSPPPLLPLGNLVLVDSSQALTSLKSHLQSILTLRSPPFVSVGFVGSTPQALKPSVGFLSTGSRAYLLDCVTLAFSDACSLLRKFLMDRRVTKITFDVHRTAQALRTCLQSESAVPLQNVMDLQLVHEFLCGEVDANPLSIFTKDILDESMIQSLHDHCAAAGWETNCCTSTRPLPKHVSRFWFHFGTILARAAPSFRNLVGENDWRQLLLISQERTKPDRLVFFDPHCSYRPYSSVFRPPNRDAVCPSKLRVELDDPRNLLSVLPRQVGALLTPDRLKEIVEAIDVALDVDESPRLNFGGGRIEYLLPLHQHLKVSRADLHNIVQRLGGDRAFSSSNRAGLPGSLLRLSANRNREKEVIGLTIRLGRTVRWCAHMITDVICGMEDKSILILGPPGSGKTTMIREIARTLAGLPRNVWIVDTSNEIAGDSDKPHPCVGKARRMMVPSLSQQGSIMIECVQNHTPDVMVIDEIGRPEEVAAARTCKQRGVRMVASAHGDFRSLCGNPQLRDLLGPRANTILSGGKPVTKRVGAPVFEVVVEVFRGNPHEFVVTLDSAEAVDKILRDQQYTAQQRIRHPQTGSFRIHYLRR